MAADGTSFFSKDAHQTDELVQTELDRRVYHLRTLYDLSRELFGRIDFEGILRNFLFMTIGNFGAGEGLVLSRDIHSRTIKHIFSMGFDDGDTETVRSSALAFLETERVSTLDGSDLDSMRSRDFPSMVQCVVPFELDSNFDGLLALGHKLTGSSYSAEDRELLITLVNNLVTALNNARSFEKIKNLNQDLRKKNEQLEKTLNELKAALRKVEILESIKANLTKFVPATVSKMIEGSPETAVLKAEERDLSVLFLDMEGYTRITERLGALEANNLVEKYFSVFMEAIYENNGDVVETSGDGLMVLFLAEDETTNALEALRSAIMIREKTSFLGQEGLAVSRAVKINMGISSGKAIVGANKFECFTGSRWVYTCHGTPINIAARICSHASGGDLLVSKTTAERVKTHFSFTPLGKFPLKNLSEDVEIFAIP